MATDLASRMEVVEANIVHLKVDAIVNAANSTLLGGGGVDGAIHAAAGPELLEECRNLGGCPTGEARLTRGHALPARWVIHAVGPVWRGGNQNEDALLASCYRNALAIARDKRMLNIAFPAISTGIYGFPLARAVPIAVNAVAGELAANVLPLKAVFCCFDAEPTRLYRAALARLGA
jgi:O-acetyl-ADP-ribose deacetylase (regulator of RNase III)